MIQVEEELANCGYELVCQKDFNLYHLPSCGGSCTCACSNFCKDEHVPNLLVFCPCAPLTSTKLYASGHIIIQDKVHIHNIYKDQYTSKFDHYTSSFRHHAFRLSFWRLHLAVMLLMLVLLLVIKVLI